MCDLTHKWLPESWSIVSQFTASSNIKHQAGAWHDICRLGQSIVFFLPCTKWQDTKLEVCTHQSLADGGRGMHWILRHLHTITTNSTTNNVPNIHYKCNNKYCPVIHNKMTVSCVFPYLWWVLHYVISIPSQQQTSRGRNYITNKTCSMYWRHNPYVWIFRKKLEGDVAMVFNIILMHYNIMILIKWTNEY